MFEEFCGSAFWDLGNYTRDENGTIIDHSSGGPDLTECFKDTALVWIPCGFLFFTTPFYLLFHKKPQIGIPHTWLNVTKSVLSVALMILTLVDVGYRARERLLGENRYPAHLLAPILNFAAMTFSLVLIQYGRRMAVRKTGVLFLYWLLQTIAAVLILQSVCRSAVSAQEDKSYTYHLIYVSIFLALVSVQLVLSALCVDKDSKTWDPHIHPNPCPEMSANFLSTISFWWFTSLMIKGYKKDLVQEDLWSLNLQDMSNSVVPKFEKLWSAKEEKLRLQEATPNGVRRRKGKGKSGDSAKMSITKNGSVQLQLLNADPADVKFVDGKKPQKDKVNGKQVDGGVSDGVTDGTEKKQSPKLWVILVQGYYKTFMFGSFLKLIHDILIFCSPLLLSRMIDFVEDKSQPMWYGYTYAALMFIVALIQSFLLHQYFHRCMVVGMRIRTAIVACVYRKSLKLSNSARKTSTVGEIVNLMSVDAQRFMELTTYLNMLWSAPFQMCVCLYFLWWILGPSILAGVGVMILMIPVNAWIAKRSRALQVEQMKFKDSRIKLMNEVLNGIKVLKLYAWELSFQKKVLAIRDQELKVLRKAAYLNAAASFTWTCAPFLVSLTTFAVYVLSDEKNILDPTKAFVSLSLFNILRFPLSMLPMLIANLVQTSVSVKRLQKFLTGEELDLTSVQYTDKLDAAIEVKDGVFSWDKSMEAAPTLDGINVKVKEGSFVGIVGQVGCGKSTLLAAMLGETEKVSGSVAVKGSVAYVAQQAWIQNATLENNILFGAPKRSAEYENVIDACALRQDIADLAGGDQTEIGEKGINLSGGQKQRVSLARAAYFDADTYLFDDPLSAVDAHVGKHIFDNLLGKNGLLKNKTRVLVTHGISYLSQLDQIIVMVDGRISEVGTYQELLKQNGAFAEFLRTYLEKEELGEDDIVSEQDLEIRGDILSRLESIGESSMHIKEAFNKLQRTRRETSRSSEGSGAGTPLHTPTPRSTTTSPLLRANGRSVSVEQDLLEEPSHIAEEADSKSKLLDGHDATAPTKPQYMHSMSKESRMSKKGEIPEKKQENKRLIMEEKAETGRVQLKVFWMYLKSIGCMISVAIVILYALQNATSVASNMWLSLWSNDELKNGTVDVELRDMRLGVYGALGLAQGLLVLISAFLLAEGVLRSCSRLHLDLLVNNLRAPMSFFDSTPIGRIINRFSKDIDVIDTMIPRNLDVFFKCSFAVVSTMFVISFSTPLILLAVLPLGVLYILIQRFYVATSRQLRRIESITRSPIYSHFGETVQGAMTIRAYKQQQKFIHMSDARVDANQISYYPGIASHRWLAIRLEFVGNTLVMFAALFAVLGRDTLSGGIIGLSISYALNITQTLNWMVRMSSELETNVVAVERVKEYSETPTEADWIIEDKRPDKKWPQEGVVEFKNYSMRYRENLDPVLKNLSCSIKGGEKIGIVGRTGAGKSSLTIGLFRIIEPCGGSVYIDGVDISSIGLHDLRSKLTIIPQDPVLFSGTLRMNLDPFDERTDEELWNALEHAHLKSMVSNLPDKLSHECTEGGENLSVGQRQLICLARALLRRSKVLVLDEATAAVDLETDDLIQSTIRTQFSDSTVLTIAHRINTIMDYTRIMVLDKGVVKEFDAPQTLLANKDSIFYGLAKDANVVE